MQALRNWQFFGQLRSPLAPTAEKPPATAEKSAVTAEKDSAPTAATPTGDVSTTAKTGDASATTGKAPEPVINGWILSPTIDLLFCCGGILWVAYAFIISGVIPDPIGAGMLAAALWWFAKLGMIVFSWGHQPATLWRVYLSPRTRKSVGKLIALWGALSLVLMVPSMLVPGFVNIFIKLIIFWQVQHVLAQAYGVALIYCYKRKYFLSTFEKDTFYRMMNAGIAFIIVRSLILIEAGTGTINGVKIPFWGPLPMWTMYVSGAVFGCFVALFMYNIIVRYVRQRQLFPWPAFLTIFSCLLPYYLNMNAGMQAAFGLFIIAYYHGSQYMVVTSAYYLKERGLPEGLPATKISKLLWTPYARRYFAALIFIGFLLSDLVPRFCLNVFGLSQAATFGTMFCVLNFHHYFTDSIVWKLKDPEVRKLLIA
jgi:hypothetical protein